MKIGGWIKNSFTFQVDGKLDVKEIQMFSSGWKIRDHFEVFRVSAFRK